MPSAPAVASHTTNVSGCFLKPNGAVAANYPVTLYKWNGSQYIKYKSGRLSSAGCATFVGMPGHNHYYMSSFYSTEKSNYLPIYGFSCWTGVTHSGNTYAGTATGTSLRLGTYYLGAYYYNQPRC